MNCKHQILRVINRILFSYYIAKTRQSKKIGTILMFHHVSNSIDSPYNVKPHVFERLLKKLADEHVVKLEEHQQEENFYAITFDDVPDDFYENAYPLLKKYNIPFTLFISTSLLGTLGYLNKEQLIEISNNKLATIGSHGVTHDYFVKFDEKKYVNELEESKKTIERIIEKPVNLFAFPYGSYTTSGLCYKHHVLQHYKYGFSTIPTVITAERIIPDYFIPRINCEEKIINNILNS